jgi:hypothetical protein
MNIRGWKPSVSQAMTILIILSVTCPIVVAYGIELGLPAWALTWLALIGALSTAYKNLLDKNVGYPEALAEPTEREMMERGANTTEEAREAFHRRMVAPVSPDELRPPTMETPNE